MQNYAFFVILSLSCIISDINFYVIAGLYAGMGVHLAKVVPNSAIMFLAYEVVNSWLSTFTAVE
jgi:hypothetical protein